MEDAVVTGWGSRCYMCVVAFRGRRDSAGVVVWMIGDMAEFVCSGS